MRSRVGVGLALYEARLNAGLCLAALFQSTGIEAMRIYRFEFGDGVLTSDELATIYRAIERRRASKRQGGGR